ncbi:glycosyltransferase family 2 protein [Paracoccus caeni]|uniref:Glycosyltransferase family 2 protein n=1 Tax=Paracoccus caeni TaxID=657651 RepID=A0A934SDH1_9RHOB|nr:glycosyltransferase family 2 protein [Paracoccus caeni]MBK4215350.1 glycosyltransferase family 2 protein [Paracoccus caeni]
MTTPSLRHFLDKRPEALSRGPLALILIEDAKAIAETLAHHAALGFRHILALSPEPVPIPDDLSPLVTNVIWDTRQPDAHTGAVNAVIEAVPPGTWLYYCYNAEFLFFPFSESRSIGELLSFHVEERRAAMLTYVIDLYAPDLAVYPDAISLDSAMFDSTGYFALGRPGPDGVHLERQLNFHGGLRWRFEEHLPADRRRIDRIALFRSTQNLRITPDHRFNIEEYNTYSCPWHHNLTAAIASFRVAKALVTNPGSRESIHSFVWRNSRPFDWRAQQLLELGLMESGQWF